MKEKFTDQVLTAIDYGLHRFGSQTEMCRASGVKDSYVTRWRKGASPQVDKIGPLFDLLGVTLDIPEGERANYDFVEKVAAKAGAGSSLVTSSESVGTYAFRKEFMARMGIHASGCIMLDVIGDSMEPLLKEGDTILVDRSQREILDGKIYLVAYGEELKVKNVFKSPKGIILHSENSRYPDVVVSADEIGSYFIVHGRVRWFGRIL